MTKPIELKSELRAILDRISFKPSCLDMGWEWLIEEIYVPNPNRPYKYGWLICCSFQRPDTATGQISRGFGRKEFVAVGSSLDSAVKTAWVCVEKTVHHELMEAFSFDGVRVFDPHKSVAQLTADPRKE